MTLPLLVRRSLRQHALSTVITSLSIALAGGLLMAVWVVKDQSDNAFRQMNGGYDAVLGARGSQLQLVLNAIFHLEASPGNLSQADFEQLRKLPVVQSAVPLAVGDNYLGFRIVGTTTNFLQNEYAEGHHYRLQAPGRCFDHGYREAVVGSFVAQKLGLTRGDKFQPYHGLIFNENDQHEDEYVVVGVLEPSNTPTDRIILIPLEGVQLMAGHDPKAATDLSAVLVKLRTPIAGKQLEMLYNKQGNRLTFAWPIDAVIAGLLGKISWVDRVLAMVAWLVAVVAVGSILASIYNTMNERRREIAILRALGARRGTITSAIILEAATLATLGMVVAFVFYIAIMSAAAAIIRAQTGVVLDPLEPHLVMLWAPAGLILLSALAGIVPAWKAYRTDVAENLVPTS